ncbi:hypothetical protein SAMN05443633_104380 [Chryseobacterium arachidis]|uniref:Uncharacterized protein n=1 Tax=Chryseobacterium arachidis TaxID=1416778 RepID=A0A1M5C2S9_9FLAO|nr:hypothetical protein SAMN05443633_104380 [Chryseobacterium arachidis]
MIFRIFALISLLSFAGPKSANSVTGKEKPTIILVHGADHHGVKSSQFYKNRVTISYTSCYIFKKSSDTICFL